MIRLVCQGLLLLGLCSACVVPPPPPSSVEDQTRIARTPRIPPGLLVEARLDDSSTVLAANVLIRNKTNAPMRLRYDFTWVNDAGGQVGGSSSSSKEVSLGGYEEKVLRDLAPLPVAVDYRIQLRRR